MPRRQHFVSSRCGRPGISVCRNLEVMPVEVKDFPATQVAMLVHRSEPQRINETAAQFIAWRQVSGLSPVRSSRTFGVAPHDVHVTQPEVSGFR